MFTAANEAAVMHLATGMAYLLALGALSANDVITVWRNERRILWFGLGLCSIALAIGPHHIHHAYHLHETGIVLPTDWISVAVALPFALLWLWLRLEKIAGTGPGDRIIASRRTWPLIARLLWAFEAGVVVGISVFFTVRVGWSHAHWADAAPPIIQAVLYAGVGWYLWQGQFHRWWRGKTGSLSGITLSMLFPTCALCYLAFGLAILRGSYLTDVHFRIVDWYGVVASMLFFVLVHSNRARREVESQ